MDKSLETLLLARILAVLQDIRIGVSSGPVGSYRSFGPVVSAKRQALVGSIVGKPGMAYYDWGDDLTLADTGNRIHIRDITSEEMSKLRAYFAGVQGVKDVSISEGDAVITLEELGVSFILAEDIAEDFGIDPQRIQIKALDRSNAIEFARSVLEELEPSSEYRSQVERLLSFLENGILQGPQAWDRLENIVRWEELEG